MSAIALAFDELFFGAGSWLGLLLLLAMIIGLSTKLKYGGVLMIPVTLGLGIAYLDNLLYWPSLIMFFSLVFILVGMARRGKE